MIERALHPKYYTKESIFEDEKEKIFFSNWIYVGHQSQVANNGDFFTLILIDQSIVVMRGMDGVLRGFYNVCPHRAHELFEDESGNSKHIMCPYHAWVFETNGQLRSARGSEQVEGFDKTKVCISEFKVENFLGFIFVNLDPNARPMDEVYPGVREGILELAPDINDNVYTYHHEKGLNANWKVAVENYNECYHCPGVHQTFSQGVVDPKSYKIAPGTNCLLHTAKSQPRGRQAYEIDLSDPNATKYASFFLWPAFSCQIYPGGVVNTYHWYPSDVKNTTVYRSWFFDGPEATPEQWDIIELDRTTTFAEDLTIIDSVQRGMMSRGYSPGPLVLDPSGVATTRSENTAFELKKLVLQSLEQ
ncbi:MAG: aromatic ring-hydroxylating dioxygenase subunit alpha [Chloroflexota bacterium]